MGNVAVINLTKRSAYWEMPLSEGQTVLERVLKYTETLEDRDKTVMLLNRPLDPGKGIATVLRDEWTEEDLFDQLLELSGRYDNIFYYWGDYPLLDSALTKRMYGNHLKYYAGYTFADGYPLGLSPEIIRSSDIEMLHKLSRGCAGPVGRNSVFNVLQKDINAFDIETEISPVDLRMLRISLSCDTKRNALQLKNLMEKGIRDRDTLLKYIEDCGEGLRTLPSYFQIQITDSCLQLCSYCPFSKEAVPPEKVSSVPLDRYAGLLDRIVDFCDDACIAVSAWGEPSLHSHIVELIEETLKRPSLSLIIETSGLGWKDDDLERIAALDRQYGKKIQWIVSLDARDAGLYEKLRGAGFEEAWARAHRLMELFKGNCWVQAVRMKENEVNLEEFYRYWKETTENIIVQKYDWFCGELEQKKITDLSPLNRDPCWHVKRDMFIRLNGDVPLCREDLNCRARLGNIYESDLETVWNAGESVYKDHLKGDYSPMCRECDEYYTFNF